MSEDLIRRSDAAEVVYKALKTPPPKGVLTDTMSLAVALVRDIPSADRPTVIRVKSIMKKEDYESLADSIRQQAPTAIVIPHNAELVTTADRPHGEWIGEADGYYNGELIYDTWYCSNCDYVVDDEEPPTWNFCPNCGARMKGADDE